MKESTKNLLNKIDDIHDWEEGQVRSNGGTTLYSTDVCSICSLERKWFSDSQNGIKDKYSFVDGETGEDLSLRQALERGCLNA